MNNYEKRTIANDIFLVLKISKLIDLRDKEKSKKVYALIMKKKPFKSKYEALFVNRFQQLSVGLQSVYDCLTCNEEATENNLFCKKCYDKFVLYQNSSNSIENEKVTSRFQLNYILHTYIKYILCILAILMIIICMSLYRYNHNNNISDLSLIMGDFLEDDYKLFNTYTKKKYFLNNKDISVIETDDGIRIGTNEQGEIFYLEILENSSSLFNIMDIHIGDKVNEVPKKLKVRGDYTENTIAEGYWANIFLQRGYPDIYILSFSRTLNNGESENVVAKAYQNCIISVSVEHVQE